jgi:hypothetical protein
MRKVLILAASFLALSACNKKPANTPRAPAPPGAAPTSGTAAPSAGAATPTVLPERAPGLWEQKISTRGMTQVSKICLDHAVEQRFTVWGQHAGKSDCSKTRLAPRLGGGWTFASSCDMGAAGKTETTGQVTGDFARSYKVSAESSISGARALEMNGTHAMTLEANWQGPCPAGMAPGDMLLPGGMKINMMKMPTR